MREKETEIVRISNSVKFAVLSVAEIHLRCPPKIPLLRELERERENWCKLEREIQGFFFFLTLGSEGLNGFLLKIGGILGFAGSFFPDSEFS